MERQTNFLIAMGEWWEARKANRQPANDVPPQRRRWLPTPGNAIFTVLFTLSVIAALFWVQSVGALTLNLQSSTPTNTVAYQGRLADAAGNPLTETTNMIFRLYAAAEGGAPLWEEQWTASNGVQVSDGLFNVMLGSLTSIPQSVVTGNDPLFLGISVGTDGEMAPRVQLGSVPFAVQALTVPDGSVTANKLAEDIFQIHQTSQTIGNWNVPSCGALGGGDHVIPGMTVEFTVDSSRTALVDVSGIGHNSQAGAAVWSTVYVDDVPIRSASGNILLGGCRNSGTDAGDVAACNLGNSATVDLAPGAHKIETWVDCDGSGSVTLWSSAMRVLLLPGQTGAP